ncbi:g5975 [Coccomyxa viridis]|uniref:G5975 protein n=1 Tax=Coccomyxa viridis TaxID=1274662 RepID=A0ABP1FU90_9CHLO
MWGMVAGVFAAATVLALGQTVLEAIRSPPQGTKAGPTERLPEPDEKHRSQSKEWKAPIWQEGTAKEIIERARRASSRLKK